MLARVFVLVFLVGCAAQQLVRQGDALLAQGKHSEAVAKYEEALRIAPDLKPATDGIKQARRAAVRKKLQEADEALSQAKYATALKVAMQARRMPMDLDDVDLTRRIDETITRAAKLAEERVADWMEKGHFVPAVNLSAQVNDASPGVASRQQWANDVRDRALEYYGKLSTDLASSGLPGSAALQLAMAKEVGGGIAADKVSEQWNRFAEPTCFADPKVEVVDKSGAAQDFVPKLTQAAQAELVLLQERCGEGTQPLGVKILLDKVAVVDKTETTRGATALPGHKVETEEVYYEEEPYRATEEVTEYELRKEMVEKRDCAPRPGKERGCHTWTEEVEVKVPVKRVQEVTKVRKVKKTRPIQGPLPTDKVVAYDVTSVTRKVTVTGTIEVEGASKKDFMVIEASEDTGHPEAVHPRLTVKADPLEALPLAKVVSNATVAVSREVGNAVALAVTAWGKTFEDQARDHVKAGRMPQAEELYLKLMALGVAGSKDAATFFEKRYGRKVEEVMATLGTALGRASDNTAAGATAASGFPKRDMPKRQGGDVAPESLINLDATHTPAPSTTTSAVPVAPDKKPKPGEKPKTSMSDDELRALEEDSIATSKDKPAPEAVPAPPAEGVTPTDGAAPAPGTTPPAPSGQPSDEKKEEEAKDKGSTPQPAPKRGPVKPKQ